MKRVIALFVVVGMTMPMIHGKNDSIHSEWKSLGWRVGASVGADYVIPTNNFLKGSYPGGRPVNSDVAVHINGDFSFNPESRTGRLYPGLYQGIGMDVRSFNQSGRTGRPISLYVYQGMPFVWFGPRLSLGYEWQFGAAFGWKHYYDKESVSYNTAISTPVTAHMNIGLKLNYMLARHWQLNCGLAVTHFSNGNTSQPNQGINMAGMSVGVSYIHDSGSSGRSDTEILPEEFQDRRLYFDMLFYAGWRKKRIVNKGKKDNVFSGNFVVNGLRVGPMWRINRFLACGGLIDFRYDQSALVEPIGEYEPGQEITDYSRPSSVFKQLSLGIMGNAEFTMPLFSVSAALGLNAFRPKGERMFYQTLTLKVSPHPRFYINIGYQLYDFKEPQNLALGIGVRI